MSTNALYEQRGAQMFPKLSPAQIERLEPHGRRVKAAAGEVLLEAGERHSRFLVVIEGALEIVIPSLAGERAVHELGPGDFTGELNTLRGTAGLTRIRATRESELLALGDECARVLVQIDAELGELMMRAFILRRMGLVASGQGEVTLVGSRYSPQTLKLREFLTRNAYPYASVDLDEDEGAQEVLDRFEVKVDEVPVVIGHCGKVFRNPSIEQMAAYLGMNPKLEEGAIHDVVIVGAGPAGLSAAVYAASEGLDTVVVESTAYGGQAATSSRIENYLGFPTGISGGALAGRAFVQAQKFGAHVNVAEQVKRLHCDQRPYAVEMMDGRMIRANAIVIATGAQYREPEIANRERFIGLGIYYAASHLEAKLCAGTEVAIVGGGNSAGQAATFLALQCRRVHILVRGDGLAASMSRYLIRRIEETDNITLHSRTQVTALDGNGRLAKVTWRGPAGEETKDIGHLFLMTGAKPNTEWLEGCVAMDEKKFVRTGAALTPEDLAAAEWPLRRAPYLLETSVPGVFAVGDVRAGSVKRVASAVGEGSICISFVHQALQESFAPASPAAIA